MTIGLQSEVYAVTFSPDGRRIVSGSRDNSVRVWDSSTGEVENVLEGHTDWVLSVAFSPDGRRIVSGSYDNSVRVWDTSTGEVENMLERHTNSVSSVAFSLDGRRRIVSGSEDNSVALSNIVLQQPALSYIRQKSVGFPHQHTGWLLLPHGEGYLMFVPPHERLPDAANILTIPYSFTAYVDFTESTLGPQWLDCYSP